MLPDESVVTPLPSSKVEVPSCLVHCFVPNELYLTKKMSFLPELVFPSNPPQVSPVT